jgi:hypothetical protein
MKSLLEKDQQAEIEDQKWQYSICEALTPLASYCVL